MSDLVRFGVAMDRALLNEFDQRIAARGYENRSEALRDLVRADLTRASLESGGLVTATLTALCADDPHEASAAVRRLASATGALRSSLSVPTAGGRSVEVLVLSGSAAELSALAGRVAASRGVLKSELVLAAPEGAAGAP